MTRFIKITFLFVWASVFLKSVLSFSGHHVSHSRGALPVDSIDTPKQRKRDFSRANFLSIVTKSLPLLSITTAVNPQSVSARGFATLKNSYDRYTPRIVSGGEFYKSDLKSIIAKNDWAGLKSATSDPPKKTKADRAKADGGIAERAALAGGFSDARVLVAADLYAAAFSDNSVSAKTKNMQEKVAVLRDIVKKMNFLAKEALGEEKESGGLFGMGSKKPTEAEIAKSVRTLYVEGGNAYNEFIFAANEGLPVDIGQLPFL